jgi:beta-glucosidase/6-phospho-beta-glucosidase/beta-galactosidase
VAQRLVDGIANNEIQSVQAIMKRCEPEHKVKIVQALTAAKDYAASAKIVEVLKNNADNAPSIIISALQNAAGLDENNRKMAVAERTHQANQTFLRKIFGDLFRVLTYNVPFNGQEKQAVIKDSEKLIDALKTYKNNLEAL